MSTHMVAFGASGSTPKQRMVQMAAGLGLLPGVIVDQHFQQRNRLGRLLAIIAQNPSLLGLGIDEDTAGVVGPDHVLEVIGRRSVTIIDGAGSDTDAWEVRAHRPLMISNVVLHSLPAGYRFDLRRRVRVAVPVLHALDAGQQRRPADRDAGPRTAGPPRAPRPKRVAADARRAPRPSARAPPCRDGAAHAADPRDARPARPQLLGARAGHPDAGGPRRAGGVPHQQDAGLQRGARGAAAVARGARLLARPPRRLPRAAGGGHLGWATSPSTSRWSSRTWRARRVASARRGRPASTAATTSSTSSARSRSGIEAGKIAVALVNHLVAPDDEAWPSTSARRWNA